MVKAELKNYRQSPRKVRLVVDVVRGKKVKDALNILSLTTRRSSLPIKKLIESAIANAKHNFKLDPENLFIKEISVNAGVTAHRSMPRARGSSAPIRKRSSHVSVVLAETQNFKKRSAQIKPEIAKTETETETEKKDKPKKVAKKTTKTKK